MHKDFISLKSIRPTLLVRADYFETDNFVGRNISGYTKKDSLLLKSALKYLLKVLDHFEALGLGIIVFDAYRPRKAVEDFGQWVHSEVPGQQSKYYPNHNQKDLIDLGFIASNSSHSRGSTIDLSLFHLKSNKLLDMGTIFDFFDESSYTESEEVSVQAQKNRLLLKEGMEKYGFINFYKEWWHFRLIDEEYPETFFNFDI